MVRRRASYKNGGTIVVLQRYAHALCFLDVFEWWYDSGTLEVRMRYAQHLSSHAELLIQRSQHHDFRMCCKMFTYVMQLNM